MARFNRFPGTQAEFTKWAKGIYDLLSLNLTSFTEFDAVRFTAAYLIAFNDAITVCQNTLDSETLIDLQSARTLNVENAMKALRDDYRDLRYFVKKVYPTNEARQNAYGLDTYGKIAYNDAELAKFVRQLLVLLSTDQALFSEQGWTQTHTDNMALHLKELDSSVAQKSLGGSGNLISTADRTIVFETLWDFTAQTREAAHRVYKNDETRLSLYLLPIKRTSNKDALIATRTARVALSNINADALLSVQNIGTVPIMIWAGEQVSDPRPAAARLVAPTETWVGKASLITDGKTGNLFVANDNNQTPGKYEITVLDNSEEE